MHLIGNLLVILGWGLAISSAAIGLPFSAVFLMGFVGTSGREAGGELAGMLLITAIGFATGYLIARSGRSLVQRKKPHD